MPNFSELHEHARKLADLTAPGQQHPGLHTWGQFVCEEWKAIVIMWSPDSLSGVQMPAPVPMPVVRMASRFWLLQPGIFYGLTPLMALVCASLLVLIGWLIGVK